MDPFSVEMPQKITTEDMKRQKVRESSCSTIISKFFERSSYQISEHNLTINLQIHDMASNYFMICGLSHSFSYKSG